MGGSVDVINPDNLISTAEPVLITFSSLPVYAYVQVSAQSCNQPYMALDTFFFLSIQPSHNLYLEIHFMNAKVIGG